MKWSNDIKAFEDAKANFVFNWFHRGIGFIYLVAFIPLFWEVEALIGSDGLQPATNLLNTTYNDQGYLASFLQFPSLFHLYPANITLYFLVTLGCIAGICLVIRFQVFITSLIAWICFISITSIGGDFFVIIIDLFLAEVGFISLFSSYYIQYKNYIPNIIWWAFKILNFKLWFSMGVIKFYQPEITWTSFAFFDTFFQAQPMPTPLAKVFHFVPYLFKVFATILLFIGEIIIPFFVFGSKLFRWISVITFIFISLLIQVNGNYGYFNILSIIVAITILKNSDFGYSYSPQNVTANIFALKFLLIPQVILQIAYCILLFHPKPYSYQNHFNFFHTYFKSNSIVLYPFKLISYWRICNPYGVFKSIPNYHSEIRLSGSYNGTEWKVYEFKYLPSIKTDYLGFYSPYYPRLDHLMFYETLSERNAKYNTLNPYYKSEVPWSCTFIKQLINNHSKSSSLLKLNPFSQRLSPIFIKIELFRLKFSNKKGENWEGEKLPFEKIYTKDSILNDVIVPYNIAMQAVIN